jgi:predicted RNA-binding Zn-ribbon protein involved in translation (DUF1610 family)
MTIRANCPTCGEVDLGPGEIHGLWCASIEVASYAFRCPRCALAVARRTGTHVLQVLSAAGIEVREWDLPIELYEEHRGPGFVDRDLVRFAERLSEDGWLEAMVDEAAGASRPGAIRPPDPEPG